VAGVDVMLVLGWAEAKILYVVACGRGTWFGIAGHYWERPGFLRDPKTWSARVP